MTAAEHNEVNDYGGWETGKQQVPYFPAHKTHPEFFIENFRKNNDEYILILVIYWKKTGLLCTKINNHLFIIETQKIIITPTKIIFTVVFTQCISNRCTGIYKFGNKYLPSAYKT
jgi:hypothetical protein